MPLNRSNAAKQPQSHTMLTPDITKSDISWEEMGILSQMLNIPECDYVTVILFIRDIDNHHTSLSGMEILLLAMSLIGGALGGFLVVLISESKRTSPAFSNGLPIMIGVQVISVGYLIIRGVI